MTAFDYRGRRVAVTGAASGIGHATAELLAELGAEVHGIDLREGDARSARFHACDLRDPGSIAAAVAAIGGPIDGVFNCAGLPPGLDPLDVVKVNFIGTRDLTERMLTLMPPGGAVVNVASNGGAGWRQRVAELKAIVAPTGHEAAMAWFGARIDADGAAYSLSKEAVIVWSLATAAAWVHRGIRVNCVCPGAVSTPMLDEIERTTPSAMIDAMAQPIGRRSVAAEQAWPIAFLGSAAASYVNGVVMPVDGGFMATRALAEPGTLAAMGRR